MTEPLVLLVTVVATWIVLRPVLSRINPPAWFVRARERGRPGVPVTVILLSVIVMSLLWTIGERRGVFGSVLLLLWIAIPLAAWRILRAWRVGRGRHKTIV